MNKISTDHDRLKAFAWWASKYPPEPADYAVEADVNRRAQINILDLIYMLSSNHIVHGSDKLPTWTMD